MRDRMGEDAMSCGNRASAAEIRYFNRHSGREETESVYGECWLRRVYGNPLGRLTLEAAVKRAWFSRLYGWLMNRPRSRGLIRPFIDRYSLDSSEFLRPVSAFANFNEFFYRQLTEHARLVDAAMDAVVFPADGRHLGFQNFSKTDHFYAKGQVFDLSKLLEDDHLARKYNGGTLVISRLCPVDYHRFHFPLAGVPGTPQEPPRQISGSLYSVNPMVLARDLSVLWRNRRVITRLHGAEYGEVLVIEVGATCVGGIVQTHVPGQFAAKGVEKGYFRFGGSMVMTLFQAGCVVLDEDLRESTAKGLELYARMGTSMGRLL